MSATGSQDATIHTMFAWPATGGVWVVSYPMTGPPGHTNRGSALLQESTLFRQYCKERTQKWVDVVRDMPGATFVTEPSRETVLRVLPYGWREGYLNACRLNDDNTVMPANWLVWMQKCFADECAYAWTPDGNGKYWVARGLSVHDMRAAELVFSEKVKEINPLLQEARAGVIQSLGGTFYADAMESPAVQRLCEVDHNTPPVLNELGQPYTDFWGTQESPQVASGQS